MQRLQQYVYVNVRVQGPLQSEPDFTDFTESHPKTQVTEPSIVVK